MNTANNPDDDPDPEIAVLFDQESPTWEPAIGPYVAHALEAIDADRPWAVTLRFVDESTMREMNRGFRGIDEATDILSFADDEGAPIPGSVAVGTAGDLALCLAVIQRNARDFGVSYEQEVRRVVLHGLLHLTGQDHHGTDFTAEPMLRLQEEILVSQLGEPLF